MQGVLIYTASGDSEGTMGGWFGKDSLTGLKRHSCERCEMPVGVHPIQSASKALAKARS